MKIISTSKGHAILAPADTALIYSLTEILTDGQFYPVMTFSTGNQLLAWAASYLKVTAEESTVVATAELFTRVRFVSMKALPFAELRQAGLGERLLG